MQQTAQEMTPMYLARIGKKVLRPGGMAATNWLLKNCQLGLSTKVLEVACNVGTTAIHIAKTYGSKVTAIDLNTDVVQIAMENIENQGVGHLVSVQQGNAIELPFPDNSFDVVINEAMLTSLPHEMKMQALAEYARVLKEDGILATHDILHTPKTKQDCGHPEAQKELQAVKEQQLTVEKWREYYDASPFEVIQLKTGDLHLFSFIGLLKDEGVDGIIEILQNIKRSEADEMRFFELVQRFDEQRGSVGHITFISKNKKEKEFIR